METQNFDIAIVGGGVGGAIAALSLASRGRTVALVDRRSRPRQLGADLLKPAGIAIVNRHGLMDALLEREARERDKLEIFHDGELLDTLDYSADASLSKFVLVPYPVILGLLLDKLRTMDNVDVRFDAAVTSVEREGDSIANLMVDGNRITAAAFIGADGTQSTLRQELGIKVDRAEYDQKMFFGNYALAPSVDECNRLYVDSKKGMAYFYPISHHEFRLVLDFPTEEAQALREADSPTPLRQRLAEFCPASADAVERVDNRQDFFEIPVGRMHASHYGKGNTLLVGDAIHNVHPCTGQGMSLALEDGDAAAKWLGDHLDGKCDLAGALAGYEGQRRPVNSALVAYGHKLGSTFHDRASFQDALNLKIQGSSRDAEALAGILEES